MGVIGFTNSFKRLEKHGASEATRGGNDVNDDISPGWI